jgi:selenocysteine lyase/cysteine desulfurase
MRCEPDDLAPLLGPRTRIVAFPHVSNLLGEIADVPRITAMAHAAGARVVVDGVAYAPHRAVDVAGWDVDWYFFSTYKVYGPHMACLYGRADAISELTGPNHFFIPDDDVPYKFEPGGVSHEACAGLVAVGDYLRFLAGAPGHGPATRDDVDAAFDRMAALETPLVERLIDHLARTDGVRLIGPAHAASSRVGTVSFVHPGRASQAISSAVTRRGIGIRHGHMYAYRLCRALGLDPEDGVVRVSLVHYNTMDEIERLIAALDEALPG